MSYNKEYKEGLKATSLFGGVQIFTILIGIIKNKFVALLIGPEGIGFYGILTSATGMVNGFTSFGLRISAVKDVSEAHASANIQRIGRTITVLRKLVWLTGMFGFVLFFLLSPLLSKLSFDTYDYILSFAAISITLLFTQLSSGQTALLQGTRHFSYMAKSTIIGGVLGLVTVVPLYYFLRLKGIVPAIIISSITTLMLSWYYSKKVPYERCSMTYREAIYEGRNMAKMGFFISLQTMLALLISYAVRLFISRVGSIADVGLFVAGFAIAETYMGLVFSAMSTEYYPRLASHSKESKNSFNETINNQIEISLILLSPLICMFLIFGNWVILLLYSEKFVPITLMICFALLGNFFKAPSWCIAYSYLARGDSKAYFMNEILSMSIFTTLQLVFFYFWGLTGVGIAYLISYILYLLQVYLICKMRYGYQSDLRILRIFVPQVLCGTLCFFLMSNTEAIIRYPLGVVIIIISLYKSYTDLSNRVDVLISVKSFLGRKFI